MAKYPIPSPLFDTLATLKEQAPRANVLLSCAPRDLQLVVDFLRQYDGNQATFNSYRREVERLLHWSWLIQKKSVLKLKRADIEAYVKFCQKPRKSWIGLKKVSRFKVVTGERVANTQWRPFVATLSKVARQQGQTPTKNDYTLSQKTIQEIFVALSSFYNYLMAENIIDINPVATIRQKSKFVRKTQTTAKIPCLSEQQWQAVIHAADTLAQEKPDVHERTLFMISALYLMYLRISELAVSARWTPMMKHFYKDSDNSWWFITVGKGNKERCITVSNGMLKALKRWRRHLGLSPVLPTPQEKNPLIPKMKGQGGITSTRWINQMIQVCFNRAVVQLNAKRQHDEAEFLANATVHWLRHTGISDDINKRGRPMAHVRDDAGHSSMATTDRYNNITLKERHASAKGKQISQINE